jgi:cytosine/uracil/thiamine/allantoin permease
MSTVPTPRPGREGSEVTPLIAASLRGRRRRPSGEPPLLPRHIDHSIRWYLLLAGVAGVLWAGMSVPAVLGIITRADLVVLRVVATVRAAWLTHVMLDVNAALASPWTTRLVAWGTIAVLVAFRRFQHLAAYLVIVLATALLISAMTLEIGRMRPVGIGILGPWQGYAQPSRPVATLVLALVGLVVASLSVNIAANTVSPANDFSNAWPRRISFKVGGVITGIIGILMMPWALLANPKIYIFSWLGTYSGFLGPIAGVLIADYWVIRRRKLNLADLYTEKGEYTFSGGFNVKAVISLVAGIIVALIGLVVKPLHFLYDYAWFVGFATSFLVHWAIMAGQTEAIAAAKA